MKVFVLVIISNDYRDISGIFSTEQKLYNHLWEILDRYPGLRWEIEEREVM